ncbi:MAG: Flp pilus assembly protein CpaB [Candidatus Sericytochromatia bacterium]|nr:Flp pilus assembly protein CpaB [Candidatus Sericytochromatia bacterium]
MSDLRSRLRRPDEGPVADPSPAASGKSSRRAKPSSRRGGKGVREGGQAGILGGFDVNRRLLLAAGGLAGLAALLAVTYLSDASDRIAGSGAKIKVWVVARDLPARHELQEGDLEEREVPALYLPASHVPAGRAMVGRVTTTPLWPGEVLVEGRAVIAGAATGVSPRIGAGERGFVYVPDGLQDVPLVRPDDRVDLVATVPEAEGGGRLVSRPVVHAARVIGVGDRFSTEATESVTGPNGAVTLAVPQGRVQLLAVLAEAGRLHFILRSPGDVATGGQPDIRELERLVLGQVARPAVTKPLPPRTVVKVVRGAAPPPRIVRIQAPPAKPPVRRVPQVEIYNGASRQGGGN